jgi:hypothetical protein
MTASAVVATRNFDGAWAVETKGLTKRFGPNVAVNGVDLRIPRGILPLVAIGSAVRLGDRPPRRHRPSPSQLFAVGGRRRATGPS